MTKPLGNVYTLDETAAKLRMSRRALQNTIKQLPFYSKNGRVYLFSEGDILAIWNGMREQSNQKLREITRAELAVRYRGEASPPLRGLLGEPSKTRKARPSSNLQKRINEMLQKRAEK
jgi:hypothetical protein